MDGWNTIVSFWGPANFQAHLPLVSGRVNTEYLWCIHGFFFFGLQLFVKICRGFPFFGDLRSTCLFGDFPYGCSSPLGFKKTSWSLRRFFEESKGFKTTHPFGNLYQQAILAGIPFIVGGLRGLPGDLQSSSGVLCNFLERRKVQMIETSSCCWQKILD